VLGYTLGVFLQTNLVTLLASTDESTGRPDDFVKKSPKLWPKLFFV
jgi:hypothetical protein